MPDAEVPKTRTGVARLLKNFFFNFLIYVLIVAGALVGLPKFLTWALHTEFPMAAITSGSMWPALKEGDLVFIRGYESRDQLQEGDIIVYENRTNDTLTIHRIVKLEEDKLTTKGDANFGDDEPVSYESVIGEMVTLGAKPLRIPFLGSITVLVNNARTK